MCIHLSRRFTLHAIRKVQAQAQQVPRLVSTGNTSLLLDVMLQEGKARTIGHCLTKHKACLTMASMNKAYSKVAWANRTQEHMHATQSMQVLMWLHSK